MDKYKCEYNEVNNTEVQEESFDKRTTSWKPLRRQMLISSGVWLTYFQLGLCIGTPTVLIPQMRREHNSTDFISEEQASWLSSIVSYCGLPWVPALPAIAWYFGRRISHAIVVLFTLLGFATLYFSTTLTEIFVGIAFLGILYASIITVGLLIITEYVSPVYRGFSLTIKSALGLWGIWVANAIGTFFHWRNIAVVGLFCGVYEALTLLAWPESPYWLADRGKLDECRGAFHWIRGTDEKSERELEQLMKTHKFQETAVAVDVKAYRLKLFLKGITAKWFYKPMILSIISIMLYHLTAKLVVSVYALDIIGKISNSERMAYIGMLILDGVSVLGMYCGSGLSRCLPRRVQLMTASSAGIVFLLLMSLYLFLVKHSLIAENVYITLTLLAILSLCVSCGPIMLSSTICGELMPLKLRSFSVAIMALFLSLFSGIVMKVSPSVFATLGLHGGFLCFGLSSFVCLAVLYKYLPETKDRTLAEISELILL